MPAIVTVGGWDALAGPFAATRTQRTMVPMTEPTRPADAPSDPKRYDSGFDETNPVHVTWRAVRAAVSESGRAIAARRRHDISDGEREDLDEMAAALRAVSFVRVPWAHWVRSSECVHGSTYRIQSRNLAVGVWNAETGGFVGIREKFGDRFLFTEYHHDTGGSFGTAMPLELLEECPVTDLAEGHVRCNTHGRPVEFRRENPDGTGQRYHSDDGTRLLDRPDERDHPDACTSFHYGNEALLTYLQDVEARYLPELSEP